MITRSNRLFIRFHNNNSVIALVIFLGLLSSCVTQRKVEYLQDKDKIIKAFKEAEFPDYRLKPNDELYIQVKSLDDDAANIFASNKIESAYTGAMQPYGASLLSYSVDKDGYLLLAVVGKIFVKDKTLSEVSSILKDSLQGILNQPNVTLKLVNRYVSVLGEVNNPGHFPYSQDKLTIFDALGLAGDIGEYGNRKNVILIRNKDGENIRINLNLHGSEILESDYYYLRPNDLVYVKPLREKFWSLRQFPYAIILSTLTTGLLIYNVVK
jgi:polysaccharide export outer membrane protein